uniref:Cytochrome b n=1 Tax=Strombidium cf. sulcatum TaxID=2793073 RepID=A0A7T0Q5S2_9SPIT|nr:cytochrome b [Strombidium cf. sulcatum]QPL15937.1 cytochrome b [Strombidium cf. sulcatum]
MMLEGRNIRRVLWGYHPSLQNIDIISNWTWNLISLSSLIFSYLNLFVNKLVLPFSSVTSVIGFMLLIAIVLQILSGFFLAWYYMPEPGLVVELREEMFNDTRFGLEVFYLHVRGVDVIMTLSYLHIFKKIFLKNYVTTESDGWILGGYAFFFFHYIIALGICLSASHLSDLTLTIIANIYWSILNNIYKSYYIIFTNKHLNTDQLTRTMVLHYFTPWYYLYLVKLHILFCHESWDSDSGETTYEDKSGSYISWFYDAFLKELQDALFITLATFAFFFFHHVNPETIAYFFFEKWNISELDEIRFYGVAPHWYFRPYMGLLVITPTHYEGLMWMGLFFISLAALPLIYGLYNSHHNHIAVIPMQNSLIQTTTFILFLLSIYTIGSMLPCGRYYYDPEGGYVGNPWVKFSIQYVYIYLCWLLHHLDFIDHYVYKFYKVLLNKTLDWYNQFFKYVNIQKNIENFEKENKKNF